MSLFEVDNIIDRIEKTMKRDGLISTDFKSIEAGNLNKKRRLVVLGINVAIVIFLIKSVIGLVAAKNSSLHFYFLNVYYGFGFLGRFVQGVYVGGFSGMLFHAIVFIINERRGTLSVFTNWKNMIRKFPNPTPKEIATFTFFLKIIVYVREISFFAIWFPLVLLKAVGAVVTAYEFNSLAFFVAHIPFFLTYLVIEKYCGQIYVYIHLLLLSQLNISKCAWIELRRH